MAGVLYIVRIIVREDKRSQGIGQSLLKQIEEFVRHHGIHKIYLETGKNWRANKFYECNGYKCTGELKNHFFGEDFVVWEKGIYHKHKDIAD